MTFIELEYTKFFGCRLACQLAADTLAASAGLECTASHADAQTAEEYTARLHLDFVFSMPERPRKKVARLNVAYPDRRHVGSGHGTDKATLSRHSYVAACTATTVEGPPSPHTNGFCQREIA